MSTLASSIQYSFGSSSHGNQRRKKERKRIKIGKEEVKLLLFADDTTLYIKNSKEATRRLLESINKFGKVTR